MRNLRFVGDRWSIQRRQRSQRAWFSCCSIITNGIGQKLLSHCTLERLASNTAGPKVQGAPNTANPGILDLNMAIKYRKRILGAFVLFRAWRACSTLSAGRAIPQS
ncbi:hypothetical protein CBOM_05670 [Ceraceosorus bombacis]|uniref:Uncharacterized protein n=1 Tax=Ceraceosorus bombacis TaxID=401625 RepID=A0A0P1BRR1_9BASI|nr:hypothetical protein CBOM_05670 [Ceraceosorus bombacis]